MNSPLRKQGVLAESSSPSLLTSKAPAWFAEQVTCLIQGQSLSFCQSVWAGFQGPNADPMAKASWLCQ
jgi:hypothetical protein